MGVEEYTLITGGAGFIGSHLARRLLANGDGVLVVDDFNDSYDPNLKEKNIQGILPHKNFLLVREDITNATRMAELFRAYPIGIVYHMAARAGVRPSIANPELYEHANISGSLSVLNAAKHSGVKKMIMASSSSVYGNSSKVPFVESDDVDHPISPYAATKRGMELIAYTYHHLYRLPIACVRLFSVYGPRQRPDMAIHSFIRSLEADEPINMFGDGETRRDYTYIDDIISGLTQIAHADFDYEVINLGRAEAVELKRLISVIAANLQKEARTNRLPEQPGDVTVTYADIEKARRLMGYDPQTGIDSGIRETIRWFKGEVPW